MDQNNKMLVPGSIIIAGIIIAGAILYSSGSKSLALKEPVDNQLPIVAAATVDDDVILGDPNAPVTIIEWGDFQCPFCAQLFNTVEKQAREEYVKTGKVRWVYRDFPLSFHPAAMPAALAAECAKDQGKYWLYHDALFENQATIETLDYIKLASTLGLNTSTFKQCVDTQKYKDEIAKDTQDGVAAGVEGTPATFINGKLISGAQPYAVFKAEIEAALAAQ